MELREREIIFQTLTELRDSIADNMRKAGQVASGKTIRSMKVDVRQTPTGWVGTLYGRPFFGALETGSRPWRQKFAKPPKFFVDIIRKWMEEKSIEGNAFLTARKIMLQGSSLYRKGGRKDIYSSEIPGAVDTLSERLGVLFETAVTDSIKINR